MSESGQSRFTDVELPELDEYQPLSTLAVFAMVASLAGIIAVFQPWLFVVPAVGVVLSVAAIALASRAESRAGGKSLATCALLLSLFLVSFAAARNDSRAQHLYDIARPHAETWLRLILEGRVKEAHQLTLEEHERATVDLDYAYSIGELEAAAAMRSSRSDEVASSAMDAMADMEAVANMPPARREELELFVALPNVVKLLELTPEATVKFVSNALLFDNASKTQIAETFSIVGDSGQEPFEVTMVLERQLYGDQASWKVSMQ